MKRSTSKDRASTRARETTHWRSVALMKKRISELTSLPSPEDIEAARTPAGGWTKAQLERWGVPWPPPRGWRRYLVEQFHYRTGMPDLVLDEFERLEREAQGFVR
jgi:hypothetical protein